LVSFILPGPHVLVISAVLESGQTHILTST